MASACGPPPECPATTNCPRPAASATASASATQSRMLRGFFGDEPPTPGRSAVTNLMPSAAVTESSGCLHRRESPVPCCQNTGVPWGSPTASKATVRPSAVVIVSIGSPRRRSPSARRRLARRGTAAPGDDGEAVEQEERAAGDGDDVRARRAAVGGVEDVERQEQEPGDREQDA